MVWRSFLPALLNQPGTNAMTRFISRAAIVAGALVFGLSGAYAGSTTANLTVTATVASACSVSVTTAVAFGSITSTSAIFDPATPGVISVTCAAGSTGVTIGLGSGNNSTHGAGGNYARAMRSTGGTYLPYGLFSDSTAPHTAAWTDVGTTGVVSYSSTGSATQTFNVWGELPVIATTPAVSSSYTDTVVVTVSY